MAQNLNEQVALLEQKYLDDLPDKLASIDNLWRKLLYTKWNDDAFALFFRLLHGMAGSAGSFGFEELGATASKLDAVCKQIIDSGMPPSAEQRNHISTMLEALNRQLGMVSRENSLAAGTLAEMDSREKMFDTGEQALVYILEDDEFQAELLELMLQNKGHDVRAFTTIDALKQALAEISPDVLIMDIMLPEGSDAGLQHAAQLKQDLARNVPVLFTSARSDLSARLEAVRAGGEGYFPKPINIEHIAARIEELLKHHNDIGYRILVIDDDQDSLDFVKTVLNTAAMNVVELSRPLQAMEKLSDREFDLIILDMHMPDVNGLELAKMIRQCGEHADTPIIFLTADTDPDIQDEAMMVGVDEYIQKPVKPDRLLYAVRNRISRVRRISSKVQYLVEKENVTGLFNRQYFFAQLEKAMQNTRSGHRQYAVFDIDIDNFVVLRDQVGADSWDLVIAGIARTIEKLLPDDTVLAYISEHMIGAMFACDNEEQAVARADTIRQAVQELQIDVNGRSVRTDCSIGIVLVDEFTISVAQVMYEVELACETVRSEQGSGVYVHKDAENVSLQRTINEVDATYERLLRKALTSPDADEGFYTVYQPIATLASERDEKYDVLLRLRDNTGKEVLPSRFLMVAEAHGLLAQIDKWVTDHVIKILAERIASGKSATFFVKLTMDSVNHAEFIHDLKSGLSRYQVPADRLVFQLAEAEANKNLRQVAWFANQLKQLGCGFALEHFGTQFNSEQLLDQLPIDYIKIDGAYMTDLGHNKENRETVSRITRQALDHQVFAIASFVEDADSLAVLWACGVNYLQGHFLQEPDAELNYDFMTTSEVAAGSPRPF